MCRWSACRCDTRHHVRPRRLRGRQRAAPSAQVGQAPREQRVGQHPHPGVPHGHRGMPPPRDLHRHRARPFPRRLPPGASPPSPSVCPVRRPYNGRDPSRPGHMARWWGASAGRESETGREAPAPCGPSDACSRCGRSPPRRSPPWPASCPTSDRVAGRRQPHPDSRHGRDRGGRVRRAQRPGVAAAGPRPAAGARAGARRAGLLPQRLAAAGRPALHPRRPRRGDARHRRADRRGDVRRVVRDEHGARGPRRRRLRAPAGPARRAAGGAARATRRCPPPPARSSSSSTGSGTTCCATR